MAVSLGNTAEFAALTYAVFKLGAILVPLNPGFNAKQVTAALNHLEVELLVIGAVTDLAYKPCRGRSNLPLLRTLVPDLENGKVEAAEVPTLKTVVVVDNSASHPLSEFPPLASLRSLTPFTELVPDLTAVRASGVAAAARGITPDSTLSPSDTSKWTLPLFFFVWFPSPRPSANTKQSTSNSPQAPPPTPKLRCSPTPTS